MMTPEPAFRMVPADQMPLDQTGDWPQRPGSLAQTLAIAGMIGERFGMSPGGAGEPGFLPADALSDADLVRAIDDRGRDVGTDEQRVATTLFLQGYVYRIAAPMLAAWVLHRRIPDVSARNLAVRFNAAGRVQDVAMREPRVYALAGDHMSDAEVIPVADLAGAAIKVLLTDHLLDVMGRLRAFCKLGLPLAKGSVASQIGMALTFVDAQSTESWQLVSRIALEFLSRTEPQIGGQGRSGDMQYMQHGLREGVTFRRGTCCLVYRAKGKEFCGGCPLRSEPELHATWQSRLLARPTAGLVSPLGLRTNA